MNPFLDGPRTVLDLAGIRAWNEGVERARAAYAHETATACGTVAGFRRHKNNRDIPCQSCRDAYNAWQRGRYAAKKEGK